MPYLYVLNGRHRHKVYHVGKKPDGELIGKSDGADVRIEDPWISWTHARVVREAGGGCSIEDLGSTNGTYVNCDKVTRRPLGEDDVLFLGRTHLLFVASDRPPSAPPAGASSRAAERGEVPGEATLRLVVPGTPQQIQELEMSRDSALASAEELKEALHDYSGEDDEAAQTTGSFRGPFANVGRIAELDILDAEADEIPLPPAAEISRQDAAQSDDHFEIDIEELGLSPRRLGQSSGDAIPAAARGRIEDSLAPEESGSGEFGAAVRVHSIDASVEQDPIEARDQEIARLRAAVGARDAEIARLRAEVTKLKEQYLDL